GVEDRALFLPSATCARGGLVDAIGEAAQGQRLQPHAAGAGERREEDALAAEERGLDLAHELDVVVHRGLERDQAPRVHAQRLAGSEVQLADRPARVREHEAVAVQALHDEALAAEEAHADLLLERDADRDAAGRAEERVLLADELAAELREVERDDLAR